MSGAGALRRVDGLSARVRAVLLCVTAGLAVAAVVGVSAYYVAVYRPGEQSEQARVDGLASARTRTEQILSYGPRTIDADLARARENVAGEFAAEFSSVLAGVVEPAVRKGLAATSTVTRAAVVDADANRVTALLYLDQRSGPDGQPPTATRSRAEVTVTRIAGQWLVTDLRTR